MFVKPDAAKKVWFGLLLTAALLTGCGGSTSEENQAPNHSGTESSQPASGTAPQVQEETAYTAIEQGGNRETQENTGIIYEGRYFDEKWYSYVDMPAEDSLLVYCEILISNVTDASFDFVINEEVMATGEITPVISAGTAVIKDPGEKAVYEGENLTLTFFFLDDPDTFPQHLEITGLEKLEHNVYINNSIPGHESG